MNLINLDNYLNINEIQKLDLDVKFGISQYISHHPVTMFTTHNTDEVTNPNNIKKNLHKLPDRFKEKLDQLSDNHEINVFLKILFGYPFSASTILLRRGSNKMYENYSHNNYTQWEEDTNSYFKELIRFIKTLPFKELGRVAILFTDVGGQIPTHPDHYNDKLPEFIWFRTNFDKKFFIVDNDHKTYVTGYSSWFDSSLPHGTDIAKRFCFSIRVDGVFTDNFRSLMTDK